MVAGGLLLALRPGRSAYRVLDGLRAGMSAFANVCRTKSLGQVYLPWFRAVGHPFKLCFLVGCGQEHKGHFESVCILHLHKFRGVGNNQFWLLTRSLMGQLASQIESWTKFCSLPQR
jgi:hypothetical protein